VVLGIALILIGIIWLLPNKKELFGKLRVTAPSEQLAPSPAIAEVEPAKAVAAKPVTKDEQPLPTRIKAEPTFSAKKREPAVKTKTVARGDTLSRLVKDVYGVDEKDQEAKKLLDLITSNNPQLKSADLIHPGQKIVFPESMPAQGRD
jgi:nucleoid-associated protein YgaU